MPLAIASYFTPLRHDDDYFRRHCHFFTLRPFISPLLLMMFRRSFIHFRLMGFSAFRQHLRCRWCWHYIAMIIIFDIAAMPCHYLLLLSIITIYHLMIDFLSMPPLFSYILPYWCFHYYADAAAIDITPILLRRYITLAYVAAIDMIITYYLIIISPLCCRWLMLITPH